VVNVSRGGLVNRNAALAALKSGQLGGLGLDVHWQEPVPPTDELVKHPRVLLTPHIAGVTHLSYRSMASVVIRECLKVQQGGVPSVWVNKEAMQNVNRTP
jgi:phosphoglycerate dehydrogenase-like enzyme